MEAMLHILEVQLRARHPDHTVQEAQDCLHQLLIQDLLKSANHLRKILMLTAFLVKLLQIILYMIKFLPLDLLVKAVNFQAILQTQKHNVK